MKQLALLLVFTLPLEAKGPPNDDFAKAKVIKDKANIVVEGSLTDDLDRFRATKEDNEPHHAGQKGQGSVWYKFIPTETRRVTITTVSEMDDLLLALGQSEGTSFT